MTHDRFSAQLRRYLLDTADERPADGQLAAVARHTAATTQRHPLATRLIGLGGHVAPIPSAALRIGIIAVALAVGTVGVAAVGGGAQPAGPTPFEGVWTSIDPADSSTQTLVVGAGATPAVHFEDDYATGDACRRDAVKVFTATGTGAISGERLEVDFPDGGGCGLRTVPIRGAYFELDPAADTLVDWSGITWFRAP